MNLIPIQYRFLAWLLLAALVIVFVAFVYKKGEARGYQRAVSEQLSEEQLIAKVREAALIASAEAIAKIEVKNVTLRQQIEGKVVERTVYRECRHDADGLRIINDALSGTTEPTGGGKLPAADSPR